MVQMNSTYIVAVFVYKHTKHRMFISLFRPEKDTARYRDSDVPSKTQTDVLRCVLIVSCRERDNWRGHVHSNTKERGVGFS